MKNIIVFILTLTIATQSFGAAKGLTCSHLGRPGQLHLDFLTKAASIKVYCHMSGCIGDGKIIRQSTDSLGHTFVLEMNMGFGHLEYFLLRLDSAIKKTILSHHPALETFSNCILN